MDLNKMITAADFLYTHSPARHVTAEKNTIIVYGEKDDELADDFFDLLVSSAYKQDVRIHLIRLCPEGAKHKELDFVCRNEKGIGAFARNDYSMDDTVRPLTIHFYDFHDAKWREKTAGVAYAIDLTGKENGSLGPVCHASREIRRLSPLAEEWTAADEERCEVLRIARKVHKAYTAGWNSRWREKDIDDELYGKDTAGAKKYYCLRSSLRFAVSIPWKLAMAEIYDDPDTAGCLCKKLNGSGGIRDKLAWQEHRSWSAFMTLEGWTAPTVEQMRAYFFRDGNDHRDRKALLHPCLWDLHDDDWDRPHLRSLEKTPVHQWSDAYEHLDDYCLLDQVSLTIHRICREKVISDEYRNKMTRLFRSLEAALLRAGSWESREHVERLRQMENMFRRLRSNETNSCFPWRDACGRFAEAIEGEDNTAYKAAKELFAQICQEAKAAVERNRYCDYKKIDAGIIDWLPWIISGSGVDTVWKLYSRDNILDNIISSVILRPRCLNLISDRKFLIREPGLKKGELSCCLNVGEAGKNLTSVPAEGFADILLRHGIDGIEIKWIDMDSLDGKTIPAGRDSVVDVTSCGEMQNRLRIPGKTKVVFCGNDGLQDSIDSGFFAPLFRPFNFTMTVNEMLRLRGFEILSGTENNEMLGMEADYETLWNVSREIRNMPGYGTAWRYTIRALHEAEKEIYRSVFKGDPANGRQFSYAFAPERFETMTRTGALGVLHDLEKLGYISDLYADTGENRLVCRIFPGPADAACAGTEKALTDMLSDVCGENKYAVVSEYLPHGAPAHFIDLDQPIRLDAALLSEKLASDPVNKYQNAAAIERQIGQGIGKLVREGLLIPAGGKNEYRFKSLAVRRELEKEGFALEAYVYYSLFLSGRFDDIRSNVRIKTGVGASDNTLEKELDILVTRKGKMGVISCKDTGNIHDLHIAELCMQAEMYGVNAKPVLVCSGAMKDETVKMCEYLNVGLVTAIDRSLASRIVRILS